MSRMKEIGRILENTDYGPLPADIIATLENFPVLVERPRPPVPATVSALS